MTLARAEQPFDIQVRWRELGRLRMGDKGPKGEPRKLMTWRLTSASRSLLEAAAVLYGGEVVPWTDAPDEGMSQLYTETNELDVVLPPMLNQAGEPTVAYSRYHELWSGGGCKRRCDGMTELISGKPCMCDPEQRECKVTLRAQVMLPRVPSIGVWRLETHGFYAASELPGTLNLLASAAAKGRFVPAVLRIEPRTAKRIINGKSQTRKYIVPVIDLPGVTLAEAMPSLLAFNTPALMSSEKPPLLDSGGLPADASFQGAPPMGDAPDLPPANGNGGGNSDASGLFPVEDVADVDALRRKIFAQFSSLKIGTPERKALVANRYALDSFSDLAPDQMEDLSKWLASAQPDEITAALKART